ncbi:S41 family peptidase [Lewinella sp. IMCC34191]|uniref:S41 family peptidase n=1 Tax=Lewinella sp. IMCC34191 TaxID=2259172 RepID=UPI000E27F662|nr:S41 family peptidase [Lewinella sp. IMCC34191]
MSETHLAFAYAGDLWVADRDGGNVRRLTIGEGDEYGPVFSPDGQTVAFTGAYDGNVDVYTVPVEGGIPERLTWHPYDDEVQGFTPEGDRVLFTSQRNVFTNRFNRLFTIGLDGGQVEQLPIPTAFSGAYSGDGRYVAYSPNYDASGMWKGYRGGTVSRIWIFDTTDNSVTEIPKPESGSNDMHPQWHDGQVYFRSDRDGEYNLYVYDPATENVEALTTYDDFPVFGPQAGPEGIVFEQAGYLHELDYATGESRQLDVTVNADILDVRPRYVSGAEHVRSVGASPSGTRLVFDYRGEIVTAPYENGDVDNLTHTPGVHESYPAWSPDGRTIAYFSDASGEHALHLRSAAQNEVREIALDGTGFYAYPHWSPDSKRLAFVDNGRNLYVLDVSSGKISKVDQDENYSPGAYRDLFGSWGPNGRYLAYTKNTRTNFEQAYVYDTESGTSTAVTDGLANATEPTFDPSGKYLYLAVSTDAGPVVNWFQQSSNDMRSTNDLYLMTLQKETTNPLMRRNDTEAIMSEEDKADEDEEEDDTEEEPVDFTIDFEGLSNRVVHLPVPNGNYRNLASAKEGELLFIGSNDQGSKMHRFSLEDREVKDLIDASGFGVTGNGEKLLVYQGDKYGITALADPKAEDLKPADSYNLSVRIDPQAEWHNIFEEMWRVNRDYFYDPNMHGVDWDAMKEKYEPFLADVKTSDQLYRVMRMMGSELGVGHHRFGSTGTPLDDRESVGGGLLGADYEVANGRYRFAKIYGGLNWNQDLEAPLMAPGVNVEEGDYLLAVDGQEVTADDNLYRFFERTAGRNVDLRVGPNADGSDARTITVTPVEQEFSLRNRDWVEGNLQMVNEATDGRVAYVYVPNTGYGGFAYFKRYFFPQVNKQAVIVDERFNGGGQIADYYIELLMRPYQNSWTYRYGEIQHAPIASIQGPKVLLIDETAGSGGDLFPYLWRQNELGPIIGKRTWGGLVGVLGYPEFIDGGSVTAPNVAFWDEDGYRVENEGVAPDIEVEQLPEAVIEGEDPQLQRAIDEVLRMLEENPSKRPEQPPFEARGSATFGKG